MIDFLKEYFFYLISYLVIGFSIAAIVYFVITGGPQVLIGGVVALLVARLIFR
jgi:uncharacterized membrane protein